jgi:hypothetical protein
VRTVVRKSGQTRAAVSIAIEKEISDQEVRGQSHVSFTHVADD